MEKDLIFFGENGITDTQANRVADFAKLAYTELETELSNISFVNKQIETINGDISKRVSFGYDNLDSIMDKVKRMGDLKSLIAWLREAISAHHNLIDEVNGMSFTRYCELHSIEVSNPPVKPDVLTEDDVVASFDVKKRNRYYELEAHATAIGQLIHKDCAIDKARKEYYNRLSNPCDVVGTGVDTIIWNYTPSTSKEEIESLFYKLQQEHAKYQSELNSIKSEIKSRVTNHQIDSNNAFEEEYAKYSEELKQAQNRFYSWKSGEQKKMNSLKIIIPNSLKAIYDEISELGKTKE